MIDSSNEKNNVLDTNNDTTAKRMQSERWPPLLEQGQQSQSPLLLAFAAPALLWHCLPEAS